MPLDTGLIALCTLSLLSIAVYGSHLAWHRGWYGLCAAIILGTLTALIAALWGGSAYMGLFFCASGCLLVASLCATLYRPQMTLKH